MPVSLATTQTLNRLDVAFFDGDTGPVEGYLEARHIGGETTFVPFGLDGVAKSDTSFTNPVDAGILLIENYNAREIVYSDMIIASLKAELLTAEGFRAKSLVRRIADWEVARVALTD